MAVQTATRHIVTTGEALRQQLWRQNGFDQQRMTSIPTGIDASYFIPGDKAAARAILGLPPCSAWVVLSVMAVGSVMV